MPVFRLGNVSLCSARYNYRCLYIGKARRFTPKAVFESLLCTVAVFKMQSILSDYRESGFKLTSTVYNKNSSNNNVMFSSFKFYHSNFLSHFFIHFSQLPKKTSKSLQVLFFLSQLNVLNV